MPRNHKHTSAGHTTRAQAALWANAAIAQLIESAPNMPADLVRELRSLAREMQQRGGGGRIDLQAAFGMGVTVVNQDVEVPR